MNTRPESRFDRRRQRTRTALQQATIALILEKGYDQVSIQDITDRADLGRGTFYLHFTDKEDIVWRTLQTGYDALDQDLKKLHTQYTTPQLEFIIWKSIFEMADQQRDIIRVILGGQGSAVLQARFLQYMVAIAEQDVQSNLFFRQISVPLPVAAQFLMGAISRLIIWWLETDNPYSTTQMAEMVFEMVFGQKPNF